MTRADVPVGSSDEEPVGRGDHRHEERGDPEDPGFRLHRLSSSVDSTVSSARSRSISSRPSTSGASAGVALTLGVVVGQLEQRDLRVVQVEGRRLGADPRQRVEVVPRRRAAGGPLERAAPAPRVVDLDQRALGGDVDVVEERQRRRTEQERAHRRDLVERGEAVGRQVVGVAARHALDTQPVLDEEGGVEADEQDPEVELAEALVEHPAGHLRPPEVEAGEHREHHGAEDDVVEVRDHEVGVGDVEVERRAGQDDARSGHRRGRS